MNENVLKPDGSPVVVGGNGGSGTRVIGQILQRAGVYLGADLNRADDDLLFTYFFKHPRIYAARVNAANPEHTDYQELLRLHEEVLLGRRPRGGRDWRAWVRHGWLHGTGHYDLRWVLVRTWRMLRARPRRPGLWGFKEPHTMFFLHGLHRRYPAGRYILVLRHGLDMVYSENRQHFETWGPSYGLDPRDDSPRNRFEFWYRSNRQLLDLGPEWLGPRFLAVRLEELCQEVERGVAEILRFVGVEDEDVARAGRRIPRLPKTYGRYLQHDTSWIDAEVEQKLAELGYARLSTRPPVGEGHRPA